jgi:hypothetical protein
MIQSSVALSDAVVNCKSNVIASELVHYVLKYIEITKDYSQPSYRNKATKSL